ncbi:DUF475 domain-containing protein, partial [Vibrio cholerae]|nr:DUF475 domain-containing protein [Vibrio cholerae]
PISLCVLLVTMSTAVIASGLRERSQSKPIAEKVS